MEDELDFTQCSVAIWGLGLIGGSLAMALTGKCASLTGIDSDPETVALAAESGIFSQVAVSPEDHFSQADLIILAAPVSAILQQIKELPKFHRGAIVLDVGSTKREIVKAMSALPATFSPIGGHPMTGKEKASFRHASEKLFMNAPFALVKLPRSNERSLALVEAIVSLCGALPLWIDAETHDQWTAMTSHLPYLIACALAESVSVEAKLLTGPGLRSSTRLAGSSPSMMKDVLLTNGQYLLESIAVFQNHLTILEEHIRRGNASALVQALQESQNAQMALFSGEKT